MAMYNWKPEYSVGNPILDEQNKNFLNLINELTIVDKEIFTSVYDEVVSYLNTHFQSEEELLNDLNYSKLEEHKSIHNDFIRKITDFYVLTVNTNPCDNHKSKQCEKFQEALIEWFLDHILKEDMRYKKLLQKDVM